MNRCQFLKWIERTDIRLEHLIKKKNEWCKVQYNEPETMQENATDYMGMLQCDQWPHQLKNFLNYTNIAKKYHKISCVISVMHYCPY